MSNTNERHLIDINESSRITGLDKDTIYRLSRQGRLRSFKVLTALRFDRADVEALVQPRPVRGTGTASGV
jgi:excisionase family DNA binding protein